MKLLFFLALLLPLAGHADIIYKVEIDLTLHKDRSVTVKEQYSFLPGSIIKRGLTRTLPIAYYENALDAYATPIEIVSITLDGQPANYHTISWFVYADDSISNTAQDAWRRRAIKYREHRIGEQNIFLSHEKHTTTITYHMQNVVRNEDGHEIFGWNFQGYDWLIDRDSVDITIHLDSLNCSEVEFYAGSYLYSPKLTASRYQYDSSKNTYSLKWGELIGGEDITGYFYFPEGTFDKRDESFIWLFNKYRSLFVLGGAFVLSLLIWFIVWFKVGRDPKGLIRMTRFESPNKLSPAECRYFRKEVVDNVSSVATVVHAAINGMIEIEKPESGSYFTLKKTSKYKNAHMRSKQAFKKLFGDGTSLKVQETTAVGKKFHKFKKSIKSQIENRFPDQFSDNLGYFVIGLIPALVGIIWAAIEHNEHFGIGLFAFLVIPGAIGFLFTKSIEPISEGDASWKSYAKLILGLGLAVTVIVFIPRMTYTSPHEMLLVVGLHISGGWWRYLMRNRTAYSKEMESKIMGYEHYLKQTEERYLDFLNNPDEAPVLFEKNLPYAIALGCESRWAKAFEKAILEIPDMNYDPYWGHNMSIAYLSHSMTQDMSSYSAYSPPSSSGGFSGGGFSSGFSGGGGGFGGGGGGGW